MADSDENTEASRVRFTGIADPGEASRGGAGGFEAFASAEVRARDAAATRFSRQTTVATRFLATFIFATMTLGWPIGVMWGHHAQTGSLAGLTFSQIMPFSALMFAFVVPPMIWLIGYIIANMATMSRAASAIAAAAADMLEPDDTAARNVRTVGGVVRGEVDQLNAGIDDALIRLASVEAMIRQHVEAIEFAGAAIETRATSAADRVAAERARLIELTETLNARADDFATAIAEKAQANLDALTFADTAAGDAEAKLEGRLTRLESAAGRALQSFEALRDALLESDAGVKTAAGRIVESVDEAKRASEIAQRVADAAAESAARNAANVGLFANRAAQDAQRAAEESIAISAREAERASTAAVELTQRETKRVSDAAASALASVREATQAVVDSAASEAGRAAQAANLLASSAEKARAAAHLSSEEVKKAGDAARRSADQAMEITQAASARIEKRNQELAEARAALEAENARLEALIEEQRRRADRLAEAIATQTERLSKLAESQLREQEAAARLAEAQSQLQRRAAEEAMRLEEARKLEQARRAEEALETARLQEERAQDERRKAEAARTPRRTGANGKDRATAAADDAPAADETPPVLNLGKMRETRAARAEPAAAVRPQADRARLDEAAEGIARRRDEPAPTRDARRKEGVSWREILTATDDAAPLELGAKKPGAADPMTTIGRLQDFTVALEHRLYGEPPPALIDRYERGDRNVFANRLLRLNENDVKRRVRAETARDKGFERAVHEFLQGFEKLLEEATTSETADEELEEYLSSPLGRVYLLIGATVGYFA